MAYVSTNSELFKVIKRELYSYVEYRGADAKERGKEFTRPICNILEAHLRRSRAVGPVFHRCRW